MMMRTLEDQKKYLRELICHYEELLHMKPRSEFINDFLDFIREEKYKSIRRLRNIREKEIECMYFAKTFRGIT
tara:strand:+ start:127 stop:345 length:219 start_codon:yes stop_codon:yes gene_type:complete